MPSQSNYDPNNIFARIIRGEIPAKKVFEDEKILAFHDISKAAPIHVLVIPKGEFRNFFEFASKAPSEEVANFFKKVAEIAESLGIAEPGFRLITNNGSGGGQSVDHFHIHLLAGKPMGALLP